MKRIAILSVVPLAAVFVLLDRYAEYSLPLTAAYSILVLPGLLLQGVLTGDIHRVGSLAKLAAFTIDCVLIAFLLWLRRRQSSR